VRKSLVVAVVVLGCTATIACKKAGKPPAEVFSRGEFRTARGAVLKAPAAADRDWRVLMLQEEPRPKKNPHWRKIKIAESGMLEMPAAGSHFQCAFTPVSFRSWPNDNLSGIDKWDLLRSVRCSADGWTTYSQAIHVVSISGDGASVVPNVAQTELGLHEVIDGRSIDTTVVLRAD
jgi:hypothetical protein